MSGASTGSRQVAAGTPELLIGRRWRLVGSGRTASGDGRITLVVERGAFGSGEHETTASCLELLETVGGVAGARVLDLGCGTGVLAIAALGLGAAAAVGVDNDPRAIAVARRNAELNDVADRLVLVSGTLDGVGAAAFDLVLANLYADVLLDAANRLVAACAPGGALVLSGILWQDNFTVRRRYEALGCAVVRNCFLEEYSSVVLAAPTVG